MIPRTAVGKYSATLPVAGAQIRLQFPHTLSCAVLFVPLWCEASHQGWSACLRLLFLSLSFPQGAAKRGGRLTCLRVPDYGAPGCVGHRFVYHCGHYRDS